MATDAKREQIKKYFKKSSKWPTLFIVGGLLLFIIGTQSDVSLLGIGILILAVGIAGIILASKKPSDQKMDEYIAEDISRAKNKSLQKASIDESELVGESVVVTGPRFWNTSGATSLYKKGKDGRLRFTPINVTVLNMTQHQIISYQACLDIVTGNFLNESTDEYFYKDVVSVSTSTDSISHDTEKFGKIQLNAAETFVLTTSGGTSIKTILKDPKLIEMMGGGDIPTTDAEKAIQVVRKMLREKKQN
jgi:hypothetical protein